MTPSAVGVGVVDCTSVIADVPMVPPATVSASAVFVSVMQPVQVTVAPPAIVTALNKAIGEVLADPALKKKLLDLGVDAKASTPAEIDKRMRDDIQKWAKVIDGAGIPKQ